MEFFLSSGFAHRQMLRRLVIKMMAKFVQDQPFHDRLAVPLAGEERQDGNINGRSLQLCVTEAIGAEQPNAKVVAEQLPREPHAPHTDIDDLAELRRNITGLLQQHRRPTPDS